MAEVRLRLTENEVQRRDFSGTVGIITEGLAIEKAQYGLYSHTSKDCLTHSCSSGCLLYAISNPWGDAYPRYRRPIF